MRTLANLAALLLAACTIATSPPPSAPTTTAPTSSAAVFAPPTLFDGARAKAHLDFLADPARGGRFTGSRGYQDAAAYVAERFREAGLEPYGDNGTFFQRYRQPLVDLAATPELGIIGGRQFVHRVDFTESVGGSSGSGTADGRVVFLGAGTAADIAAVAVRGAVVLVVATRPETVQSLIREGAGALVIVSDRLIKFSYIPRFERATLPVLVASERVSDELLAGSGRRIADLRRAVEDQVRSGTGPTLAFEAPASAHVSLRLTDVREVDAVNVVGILRGADESAAKRAVLVGGHLDGVGTDPNGAVFEAANDNASGPAVIAELARAVASRRAELRGSVIFIAFAGEEQGLYGSEHFASQESRIPGRVETLTAFINLDVVGCCGATLGASEESPTLHARVVRAAEAERVPLASFRGSSDHASFARRRVDVAQVGWADVGRIHTFADTRALVTAERLEQVGRVVTRVVVELAAAN